MSNETFSCPTTVEGKACVSATIAVTPDVNVLDSIEIKCDGCAQKGDCETGYNPSCSFKVHQNFNVKIPLTFGIKATITDKNVKCKDLCDKSTYIVDQLVHVSFPISYSATVEANVNHVSCCKTNAIKHHNYCPCPQTACREKCHPNN